MRKVIEMQSKLWKPDISKIEFDLQSRDEIPKLLIGLQYIYSNRKIRQKVFKILEKIIPANTSCHTGRPGMELWKILVLGTLRLNCNWDFDKVHEIANNHRTVRLMLGHDKADFEYRYGLQTIKDNVSLLTVELLDEINQVVVSAGHELVMKKEDKSLKGSCDSFVVETDVHYPTDTNLLFDATRKVISLIAIVCSNLGITDWRQSHSNILKVKGLLRDIEKLWRFKPKDENKKLENKKRIIETTCQYIRVSRGYAEEAKLTISILRQMGILDISDELKLIKVEEYIRHAERQIDQIQRRLIDDETIPHKEKVFSIFQPHTEWISKGKAGVPQELGLKVCVVKDQYSFILYHLVMEKQTDEKVAVAIVEGAKDRFSQLDSCSFDHGFYSPGNKKDLAQILDRVILPKKGKLSEKDKQIEHSESFVGARRKHAAVESSINALENHGLDRCLDHGIEGFKRYVALAVLARNIQILGHIIQQKQLKRQKRQEAKRYCQAA
jgi:hypothetical protein